MRHQSKGRKLTRSSDQKKALMRSLARSLILHERISTTEAKAKELRPYIEKIITRSKSDTVANRRLVSATLGQDDEVVKKLFAEVGPRYTERPGGYVRIVKRTNVREDGAKTAYIAFV